MRNAPNNFILLLKTETFWHPQKISIFCWKPMDGLWVLIAVIVLPIVDKSAYYVVGDPRATQAALICGNRTASASDRDVFVANFLASMDALTSQINQRRYGASINGTGNNTVYAFGECMRDLSQRDCNLCIAQCKTQILRCLPFQRMIKSGRLIYDGCYLRYDDYMFFNESLSPAVDRPVCGADDFAGNRTLFAGNVMELARNASTEGPKNDGFFTGLVNDGNLTVYGLAQCWEFVNGSGCVRCLEDAVSRIGSCPPKAEGRAVNTGCYMRYSLTRFYDNSSSDEPVGGGGGSRRAIIISSLCGGVACLLFIALISYFVRKKILRRKREKKKLGALLMVVNRSKINFSYESLERATNYFNESNKLGQGGSGSVYKGILSNGQTVAVKRLFFNTTQWVDHFFNEVNLISGIEHPNLVKLLGCSVTGPESLLVYEYVPNQSLHDYLFVRQDVPKMGWEERYKIILGTAKGLAFLHEESKLRIIHRDIKLSNVLLDDDFTPKIADFGLARMFPEDETHISTAVAGTLGYMAPEYIVRGKLTEKADVYSYGVLVIEVITGERNNAFSQNSQTILQKVWSLNRSGKLLEAMDPSMKGKVPEEGAARVLQIGLICVQAAPELRPSMSAVVMMLTSNGADIPQPTQPPFLNSSSSAQGTQLFLQPDSNRTESSGNEITESFFEPR